MALSKKYYERVAEAIGFAQAHGHKYKEDNLYALPYLEGELIQIFQSDNPKFDKERFMTAIEKAKKEKLERVM
jgi:hypothetical protein